MAKSLFPGAKSRPPRVNKYGPAAGNSGGNSPGRRGEDGYVFQGARASPYGGGERLGDKHSPMPGVRENEDSMGTGGFAWDKSCAPFMGKGEYKRYPPTSTKPGSRG